MGPDEENGIPEDEKNFKAEPNSESPGFAGSRDAESALRSIEKQSEAEGAEVLVYLGGTGFDEEREFHAMEERWKVDMSSIRSYAEALPITQRHLEELRQFRERVIAAHPERPYPAEFIRGQKPEAQHALRTAEQMLNDEMAGFQRLLRQLDSHRGLEALQQFRDQIEVDFMLAGNDLHHRTAMMEKKLQEFREFRRAQMAPPPDQPPPDAFI